ncbi:MAG: hypothetical protein ABI743_04025, partial [bacterium]
ANPGTLYFSKLTAGTFPAQTAVGMMDYIIGFPSVGSYQGLVPSITLAGTSGSDFVAVWQSLKTPYSGVSSVSLQSNLKWNRSTGGTWGTAGNLYVANSDHDRCVLQRAPDGKIWLTCINNSTGYLGNYDGTSWTPSLASVFATGQSVYATFDAAGRGLLVASSQNFGATVYARHFNQTDSPATVGTLPLVTLSPSTAGVLQRFPMATGLGDGSFSVVFTSTRYGTFTEGQELDSLLYQ